MMTFPNLFLSVLKSIHPKEYGIIAFALLSVVLLSSGNASHLNADLFEKSQTQESFSLLSSCSFEGNAQESQTSFDVIIMRRQKSGKLFYFYNNLCSKQSDPRVCTRAYYSCTLGNFDQKEEVIK